MSAAGLLVLLMALVVINRDLLPRAWNYIKGRRRISVEDQKTLLKYFDFYKQLPQKSRLIFDHRVVLFMEETDFIPREMESVTHEMKLLISASAIQITFGFKNVLLAHFRKILVYPDQFFSSINQRFHKGEVNPKMGVIVLSWKHFVEGYVYKQGINLGLHEMAHALQIENLIKNKEYAFLNPGALKKWEYLASLEISSINSNEYTIFRPYGGTDQHEFFAVAVEVFFEQPERFYDYNPELYKALARVLRQNPLWLLGKKKTEIN